MFPGAAEKIVESFAESPIEIKNQLCSRFRSSKSSCQRCIEVCPADVLKISEAGVEADQVCIGCGACFNVCPNGVFCLRNDDDRTLASRIVDILTQNSRALIRFACYQVITEADILLPCLGRLTENLILVAFRHGAKIVEVHRTECKGCALEKGSSYVEQTLTKACLLAEMSGANPQRIQQKVVLRKEEGKPWAHYLSASQEKPVSRRHFLQTFTGQAVVIAASALPSVELPREEKTFREVLSQHRENPKRTHLREILKGFERIVSTEMEVSSAPLAELEVTAGCIGCNVCETLCPTGAIIRREEGNSFSLIFRPYLCTNCALCWEACLPGAIQAKKTSQLGYLMKEEERTLLQRTRRSCRACGIDFIGEASEFCPLCLKKAERQKVAIRKWILGVD